MTLTRISAVPGLIVALSVFLWPGTLRAADPPAQVDESTLERGRTLFESGKYVDAEKLLKEVLAAIDAGKLPQSDLGRCTGPLADIYRAWGRQDDALKVALRYRKFVLDLKALDPGTRDRMLDQNTSDIADILTALDRTAEAEKLLQDSLAAAEKKTDGNPLRTLTLLAKLARLAEAKDDSAKAHEYWDRAAKLGMATAKKIEQKQLPATQYADCVTTLAAALVATDKTPDATRILNALLANQTAMRDAAGSQKTRVTLGSLCAENGQYDQSVKMFQDAIAQQRQAGADSPQEAELLSRMAAIYLAQGAESEARKHWDEAAAIYGKVLKKVENQPDSQAQAMTLLNQLQIVDQQAGRFPEAIEACRQLLDLRQKSLGDEHPLTIAAKSDLGALYGACEYYDLAKPFLTDTVKYWQRRTPAAPLQLARALNDLAVVERGAGSLNEAKSLLDEALKLRKQFLKADDVRLADTYANLASVLVGKGQYAQAVVLLDQAIDAYRAHGRSSQKALSRALLNQAMVFKNQGQLAKASDYCQESLQVYQTAFGNDSAGAIDQLNTLAALAIAQHKLPEAAESSRKAWQLCQRNHLEREPIAGATLYQKASVEFKQNQSDAAERDWRAALEIQQAAGQTAQVAMTLNYLAYLTAARGKTSDAVPLYRRALQLQGSTQAHPMTFYLTSCNLAEILHDEGKTDEAIKLVQDAVKVIETPRAGTVGGEGERAEYFAEFSTAFDLLVEWNLEQQKVDEAFAYAERGRNRTFLDQLNLAGVDLRDTLTGPAGDKLRERERILRSRLGTLRAEALAANDAGPKPSDSRQVIDNLSRELEKAQDDYAQVWSEIRNASPYYRQQLSRDAKLSSLGTVRSELAKLDSLMLFYYVGSKKSYLLVIDPSAQDTLVVPLEVPADVAESFQVKPGPLTRPAVVQLVNAFLADVRDRGGGRGLAGTVHSEKGVMAAEQGATLAEVLVPRPVRSLVEKRAPKCVMIVPDGALHELSFEALLLERQPTAKYLLDVFPPVAYAPSANILVNLLQRPAASGGDLATLTVGNPKYAEAPAAKSPVQPVALAAATSIAPNPEYVAQKSLASVSRAAYLGLGGQLPPLPATAKECDRISKAFQGSKVTVLEAEQATERNVRSAIGGCRFIHLAAHGLVDQQHDNLFGAIALSTPTQPVDSSDDDGFLSLHEIHELPLSNCQLAVLSACQTNVGPDRPMEAGSTIAQAFLAAGARRAVCSHWNVDDASTAELIGGFFERIAAGVKQSTATNNSNQQPGVISYAAALHEAQLKVRSQPQWNSPYFWAPFVLIGPPQ
jgi:CHAT domain-containing protein/tetratricopeptide (TPR) repeat protein